MEPYHSPKINYSRAFIVAGLLLLSLALVFGLAAALEYVVPGIWRDFFSFEKLRPLHVSSAVFWILSAAMGSVITYLSHENNGSQRRVQLLKWQFWIFTGSFFSILVSYGFGIFGGREYWEFHPLFALPIVIGWLLFIVYFISNLSTLRKQPVYVWMWFTGCLFFLFTYLESNLWLIPQVRDHLIKDMTIQWKSYGSLVGSWNLLIYGCSIYLMDRIAGNKKYSTSNLAFAIYFLGLFNLMFNWGHHVYTLPTQPYVKYIGYFVSMTELLLLGRMIYLWRSTLSDAQKKFHILSFKFLIASEAWVFLTLTLAIAMSIPAFNIYMHGTHIVVAHTMGATIGINTMLLLAFATDIIPWGSKQQPVQLITRGYWIANISLLFFWIALLGAGIAKAYWQFNTPEVAYGEMIKSLHPYFLVFFIAGCFLAFGLLLVILPLIQRGLRSLRDS